MPILAINNDVIIKRPLSSQTKNLQFLGQVLNIYIHTHVILHTNLGVTD